MDPDLGSQIPSHTELSTIPDDPVTNLSRIASDESADQTKFMSDLQNDTGPSNNDPDVQKPAETAASESKQASTRKLKPAPDYEEPDVIIISSGSEHEESPERSLSPDIEVVYCGPGKQTARSGNVPSKKQKERRNERSQSHLSIGLVNNKTIVAPGLDPRLRPRSVSTVINKSAQLPVTVSGAVPSDGFYIRRTQKRSSSLSVDLGSPQAEKTLEFTKERRLEFKQRKKERLSQGPVPQEHLYEDVTPSPESTPEEPDLIFLNDDQETLHSELRFKDQIIPITSSACWLVLTDASVIIAGICRVNCIIGFAEICGFMLTPESNQLTIPSFAAENWLSVFGCGDPVNGGEFEKRALEKLEEEYVKPCRALLDRFPDQFRAVLFLSSVNHISDLGLTRCVDTLPQLLPKILLRSSNVNPDRMAKYRANNIALLRGGRSDCLQLFHGCTVASQETMVKNQMYIDFKHKFWERIKTELSQFSTGSSPVILLCGAKNVGKSTTVRFIINYLLRTFPEIQCFDCDLGQSECNPPGCCAIHTCTQPLLGAPFCRMHQPDVACYLAEVSPANVVREYEDCIRFVYETGRNKNLPVIVNTMGWVEKLGLHLLQLTAELTKPDLIIDLVRDGDAGVGSSLYRKPDCRIVTIPSAAQAAEPAACVSAAVRRKMAILAYLNQISRGPINDAVPFRVKFADVSVYFTDTRVPVSHIFTVLLGSYVGLAHWDSEKYRVRNQVFAGIRIVKDYPLGNCVGFGIVRGIDPAAQLLFVLTPLPDVQLGKVNLLMHGTITVPQEVYLQQNVEKWEGPMPKQQYQYACE